MGRRSVPGYLEVLRKPGSDCAATYEKYREPATGLSNKNVASDDNRIFRK